MPDRFLPRRVEQAIAESELAGLGLHVDLANEGDIAGDRQLEETNDESVELGDTDPASVIFYRGYPIADSRLLGEQCSAATLVDQVMARRCFEFGELIGVGDLRPADHLVHRVS